MKSRLLKKIRYTCFPNERQRMGRRWNRDGGDAQLRFNYDLKPSSLVLDIGGYKGQWTSDLYSMYRCRIMIFEPVSHFADAIERRFRNNPDIGVYRFGLGKTSRTETMSLCEDGSSIYRRAAQREEIHVVDIASWLRDNSIDRIDVMKVNIEGGEYELLERLIETGLIEIVSNLQVQFHPISRDSADRMEKIQDSLSATHHPTYQYRFVWENWVRNEE